MATKGKNTNAVNIVFEYAKEREGQLITVLTLQEITGLKKVSFTAPPTPEYNRWAGFIKNLRKTAVKQGYELINKKDGYIFKKSSSPTVLENALEQRMSELNALKEDNQKLYNELCDLKEKHEELCLEREELLKKLSEYEERLSNVPAVTPLQVETINKAQMAIANEQNYKGVIKFLASLI